MLYPLSYECRSSVVLHLPQAGAYLVYDTSGSACAVDGQQDWAQKAMGSGAVRSQMDTRVCFRERRDVDLILGQACLRPAGMPTR